MSLKLLVVLRLTWLTSIMKFLLQNNNDNNNNNNNNNNDNNNFDAWCSLPDAAKVIFRKSETIF